MPQKLSAPPTKCAHTLNTPTRTKLTYHARTCTTFGLVTLCVATGIYWTQQITGHTTWDNIPTGWLAVCYTIGAVTITAGTLTKLILPTKRHPTPTQHPHP